MSSTSRYIFPHHWRPYSLLTDAFQERSLEARVDIPPGIHVIAPDSATGYHDHAAAAAYNNPFHIGVNVGQRAVLTVSSYAAYTQVVTFSGVPGASGNVVFSGSGEGVPMRQNGQTSYTVPAQNDGYLLTVLFQYSTSPGGPLRTAVINNLPTATTTAGQTVIKIRSEDSVDNDNDDSFAIITIS